MFKSDGEILESLTLDDLKGRHREIAEAVGVEGIIRLAKSFGGNPIYIPKKKDLVKEKVYKMILDEYDGTNIKKLSVKYDVCETTVYNIVRAKIIKGSTKSAPQKTMKKEGKEMQIPGQMDFMDIGF